jgi:hypothetical protein
VRELGSKLLAGALSAGVILLWWPTLFPVDTLTSWLARGLAWTLMFELLVLAMMPFERSLWGTKRGQRLGSKMDAARSRIVHQDQRRRLGRQGAVAFTALAVPLVALGAGVSKHVPVHTAKAQERPLHVTRVVKVVKQVQVKRVVKREVVTVPPSATGAPQPSYSRSVVKAPSSNAAPATPKKAPASKPRDTNRSTPPQVVTNEPGTDRSAPTSPAPCSGSCDATSGQTAPSSGA